MDPKPGAARHDAVTSGEFARLVQPSHPGVAGGEEPTGERIGRQLTKRILQKPSRFIETLFEEVAHSKACEMKRAPRHAGIEPHRGFEMVDRETGLAGNRAHPAAPQPGESVARIAGERAVDQSLEDLDVFAGVQQRAGGGSDGGGIVWRSLQCPARPRDALLSFTRDIVSPSARDVLCMAKR